MERFFDLSVDLMAISDLSTTILQASSSFRRIGWDPTEVVGQRVLDLIHPDDLSTAEAELVRILEGGEAVRVTVRLRGGDGEYRWVQGNAIAALDIEQIYFTGADVSARKELEDHLLERVRLEELVATVAANLIGTDLVERTEVEDAIEAALGRIATALGADGAYFLRDSGAVAGAVFVEWSATRPGRREHQRIPLSEPAQGWWRARLADGQAVHIDDVRSLDGPATEVAEVLGRMGVRSLVLVPLHRHERFAGFVGLVTGTRTQFSDDVDSLLRVAGECFMGVLSRADATAELIDARRQLEQRNRDLERSNADLENFARDAAHDLSAPLGRIEMALGAAPGGEAVDDDLLDIARRAAVRMRELIKGLLAYARIGTEAEEPEEIDLDAVLDEVLSDLHLSIEEAGVRVERRPLPTVEGHRSLLGQLLLNLVGNSVKFARPDRPALVRIEGETRPDGTTIRVVDNGIGIEPAQREAVFGVLTRLNPTDRFPGSGIGLATCAKVVAHHHGRIWVDDGDDGGAAVNVWLPSLR